MLYDLFICHASEDKLGFVRPLAAALRTENVEVWYDEFSLKVGDSIRRSIDKGLRRSRFGAVILSKAFFAKKWPQYELDGLIEREMHDRTKVILPIWHGVSYEEVLEYSPALANRKAASSASGLHDIVADLLRVLQPKGSPLIIARDSLLQWNVNPPVITDPYWLNIVEASNRVPACGGGIPSDSIWGRWSFPLPEKEKGIAEWGERLAWTAMQLQWTKVADEKEITQITRPQLVLDFINTQSGLYETCMQYPTLLAEYAPQLTIKDMGGDFEPFFEKLYLASHRNYNKELKEKTLEGSTRKADEKALFCQVQWALRHPTFGNYLPSKIANTYFMGEMFGPLVSFYELADYLFWLLSKESTWLPPEIRSFLTLGMAEWQVWPWGGYSGFDRGGKWKSNGAMTKALFDAAEHNNFVWTNEIEDDCIKRVTKTIKRLKLRDKPKDIFDQFTKLKFVEKFIAAKQELFARNKTPIRLNKEES